MTGEQHQKEMLLYYVQFIIITVFEWMGLPNALYILKFATPRKLEMVSPRNVNSWILWVLVPNFSFLFCSTQLQRCESHCIFSKRVKHLYSWCRWDGMCDRFHDRKPVGEI